ncbi:MAG TPA: 4Fe-4S dicluster domain-containing protein [Bacteroidales bacterium]|nr:4Fe-4S dicluster domain-containing protein [Bacteroidales bacterium]HPS17793.1 4Fe-4S dicluster domain-containing protein [Bacteroidales bacterium]
MAKINPDFAEEIKKYGAQDFNACYNCGNCTAVCSMTDADNSFPRKIIRYTSLGLEGELQTSVEPWLCYYCGDCSTSCPRQADPGNLMMSVRRYLVAKYDWTGLSKKLYTSKVWELGAIIFVALIVLLLFILYSGEMTTELTTEGGVKLNTFAPWQNVEILDWSMAGLLSFFLLSNIVNMFFKIVLKRKDVKVPLKLYFTELFNILFHFFTQWNFSKCNAEKKSFWEKIKSGEYNYWLIHLFLMTAYVTMFIMIVGFLGWFQTDNVYKWYHPQRLLGYYATAGIITGIIYFAILRIKKIIEKSKKTHFSDWTFLILLFLTAFSGILLHFFRIYGMPYATYYTYVIHMMILIPMLIIEVPFSKWSHLAYRPFAIYFSRLIIEAKKIKK